MADETPVVEAASKRQADRADARDQEAAAQSRTTSSRSSVNLTPTAGSRTIFGLMAFAVLFSLVGNEIKSFQSVPTASKNPVSTGVRIIIGGFAGSMVLILVSKAGEPGRKFAVGTASVVTVAAVFVYGGPVWKALAGVFGSQPTKPTGATTGGTSPTTGTGGSLATTGTTAGVSTNPTQGSNPT